MFTRSLLAALMVGVAASTAGCATSRFLIDAEVARTNTHTVLAFEETVYNKHQVKEGFERYVGPGFRQHSGRLPDDREAAIGVLSQLLTSEYPASRMVVERTVAQGDLVAAQVLWDQKPGETRGVAMVDIYRLQNGKIVEHWDVAQNSPDKAPDDNGPWMRRPGSPSTVAAAEQRTDDRRGRDDKAHNAQRRERRQQSAQLFAQKRQQHAAAKLADGEARLPHAVAAAADLIRQSARRPHQHRGQHQAAAELIDECSLDIPARIGGVPHAPETDADQQEIQPQQPAYRQPSGAPVQEGADRHPETADHRQHRLLARVGDAEDGHRIAVLGDDRIEHHRRDHGQGAQREDAQPRERHRNGDVRRPGGWPGFRRRLPDEYRDTDHQQQAVDIDVERPVPAVVRRQHAAERDDRPVPTATRWRSGRRASARAICR